MQEQHTIPRLNEQLRKPFEESVGATLALNLERNERGYYVSNKTANLFIAFCYGFKKGEGDTKSFPAFMRDLDREMFAVIENLQERFPKE